MLYHTGMMLFKAASPVAIARFSGLLYLIIIVVGLAGELFVRASLISPDNPAQTARNILESASLFRMSLAGDAIMAVCDIALAILLFFLLRPVSLIISLMAMVFRLVQAAIIGGNLLNQLAAIHLLQNSGNLSAFGGMELEQLALFSLGLHAKGYDIGLIFFGVNCLLVGFLVFRSTYLPCVIGLLVAASGLVYLTGSFLVLLNPEAVASFQPAYVICIFSETVFCLWLIFMGVNREHFETAMRQAG